MSIEQQLDARQARRMVGELCKESAVKVWTNQHCDVVVAVSAPNAGYWCVFSGTHRQCLDYVKAEA